MRRVLLHLGFHKTGTSSAQAFLRTNRRLINPRYALVLPQKTRQNGGLVARAFDYTRPGQPQCLAEFEKGWAELLSRIDFGKRRGLILSDENLSGPRPGTFPGRGYAKAGDIANCMVEALHRHFAPEPCDITVYLSLRGESDWLRSLWVHELRKSDLEEDLEQFAKRVSTVLSIESRAAEIGGQLQGARLKTGWLEDLAQTRFGPGTPFANFLESGPGSFDRLAQVPPKGSAPDETTIARLLELNRADIDPETRQRLKTEAKRRAKQGADRSGSA